MLRAHGITIDYWRDRVTLRSTTRHESTSHLGEVRLTGALVTHLHRDHLSTNTLRLLHHNRVRLWVHASHVCSLEEYSFFQKMRKEGLLETYTTVPLDLNGCTTAIPLRLPHDSVPTSGFVFDHSSPKGSVRFAYFADLGHFPPALVDMALDCDLLALEFNHDVALERSSGRHPRHIARVLGPHGHLSNEQAAQALRMLVARSQCPPRHLALLHISADCNTPELALAAASGCLRELSHDCGITVTRHRQYAGSVELT